MKFLILLLISFSLQASENWPKDLISIQIKCGDLITITKKTYKEVVACNDLAVPEDIKLSWAKDVEVETRVLQKTETSVSLMDEGPHIDLVNWKHAYSKSQWLTIEKNKFSVLPEQKANTFPKFTQDQLQSALKDEMKGENFERWSKLAEKCGDNPKTYPCGLGNSAFEFKFFFGEEEIPLVIKFTVPMGC